MSVFYICAENLNDKGEISKISITEKVKRRHQKNMYAYLSYPLLTFILLFVLFLLMLLSVSNLIISLFGLVCLGLFVVNTLIFGIIATRSLLNLKRSILANGKIISTPISDYKITDRYKFKNHKNIYIDFKFNIDKQAVHDTAIFVVNEKDKQRMDEYLKNKPFIKIMAVNQRKYGIL